MMQRCSELGNNPEALQQLFRLGKNRLKVKKGADGHYLEHECRDELQKTLPATTFDSLMSSVATWMARLDEKDKKVERQRKAAAKVPKKLQPIPPVEQQTSESDSNNELSAVVDLCSDGDEKSSLGTDEDSLDTETVASQSSVVIIDDDPGEVNLKEFAEHVKGKLDVETLKKNNEKYQNITQDAIVKVKEGSDALRRSLKTYERKRKPTVESIGEASNEAMTTNQDPKILREINREACREAGQKSRKSDFQGTKVDKEVTANGGTTLVPAGNSQQKLQIVTEPAAYYNLVGKHLVEDIIEQSELESKLEEKKTEPEKRTNAKENEPKKSYNLEQAEERTKDGAVPEDSLGNQRIEQDIYSPQIRIRTDLGPHQTDAIRVRTDLLHEQQSPSAETLVPERTPNKRILPEAQSSQHPPKRPALETYYPQYALGSVAAPSSSCQLSNSITPGSSAGNPSGTPNYQGNPTTARPPPVNPTPSRPPQVNPAPALPVVTVKYKLPPLRPFAPVTSTSSSSNSSNSYQGNVSNSCQQNLSINSSHTHNSVNSASVSSSGYPPGSHMYPVTSTSSHQPNNTASRVPITNGGHPSANPMPTPQAPYSNFSTVIPITAPPPAESPIIPMMNQYPPSYPYQPSMLMAAAPVGTSMHPPRAPAASIPPSSYAPVPPMAPVPAPAMAGSAATVNPPFDLARIMDMLSQVELFAFGQDNQEAFHLVSKLRNSLQRKAAFPYRR
ncbi:actin cytoskeleton-regulatory complex protein pan1 [Drosophila serrata]|uniref:actin cytoskeleton-regulatory complex protein pan1 n=1 Tax=Drosophila serrata TaxID=7274 RepID=UPI000A1D09FC|nr:actin cytoskeleton-regulatory complex protein pan1 [Drosophila serrata]